MLLHWVSMLWGPMWPNIFSPNAWTLIGIALHLLITLVQRERHHRESEARADERHEDMKQHVTDTHQGGASDG